MKIVQRAWLGPPVPGGRLRAAVAAVSLCFGPPAAALGLGAPEVNSYIGQPLALRVPLTIDDTEDLGPQCLRLINQPDGDLPGLGAGRVTLERGSGATALRITSLQPVHEPALRIALEVGCQRRVRRDFTVLLDPPPLTPPPLASAQPASPVIEFGPAQVLGTRGQPLLVHIPVLTAPALAPECVRAARGEGADTPRVLNDARAMLLDRDGRRTLRLYTPNAVNDERVRVIVEIGCEQPVRREFSFLLEPPRLAATAEPPTAATVAMSAPRRVAKAPPRARAVVTPPPVAPATPLASLRDKASPTGPSPMPAPSPAPEAPAQPARAAAAPIDQLVLKEPEELAPSAGRPVQPDPEVSRQIEVLTAEVKQLRAELEAANRRYRELESRRETASYAWAAGLAAVLLIGIGLLLRRRPRAEVERASQDATGPLTRILGQPRHERRAAAGASAAAAATAVASAEAPLTVPAKETGSAAIQVTEIGDTTQVIGELYATYVSPAQTGSEPQQRSVAAFASSAARHTASPPTEPGPPAKTGIALDPDLGQEPTTMLAPQTKTEIAVDIDLGEGPSGVAPQLEQEYEKVARDRVDPDPATPSGTSTVPLSRGLDLDLELPPALAPKPKTEDDRR